MLGKAKIVTYKSVFIRIMVLLALLVISLYGTWLFLDISHQDHASRNLMLTGLIIGLLLATIVLQKNEWAPYLTPMISIFQGLFLGAVTYHVFLTYAHVLGLTLALEFLLACLMLLSYGLNIIKPSPNFKRYLNITASLIILIYIVAMLLAINDIEIIILSDPGAIGKSFSVFVILVVSLLLIINYELTYEIVQERALGFMAWYVSFKLNATLLWLFIECMRFVMKFYASTTS